MARRKTEQPEQTTATTVRCGYHHDQTVAVTTACGGAHGYGGLWPPDCGFLAPLRFGASFWFAGFCLESSILGLLCFFCFLT